ncbi:MAG: hypothetical protein JJT78_17665 [Leptospira sp.]|nr:hypothetical protein [Leptospira sp.]
MAVTSGVALLLIGSCATSYTSIIRDTEKAYYSGNYQAAIPKIRELANRSDSKDRLLYLMEAGMIFHTKGDYDSSNKAFKEAEQIADNIKVSVSKTGMSFFLSDNESNFRGEDFERVLIKFYIALNYIFIGQYDTAKIYFRRLDVELQEMKYVQGKYRQNLAARYLDAVLSEVLGRYNDARVQYRNIEQIEPSLEQVRGDRYVLAVKENDQRDIAKLRNNSNYVQAFDNSMNPISYERGMGELVIINQAGKAATKESRGRLFNDQFFALTLRGSVETAIRARGEGASAAGVLAAMSRAENPVPIYKDRDPASALPRSVLVNNRNIGNTMIFNDYSDTAKQNFNENYKAIVTKNVASIAVKMVGAYLASEAAAKAVSSAKKNKSTEQQMLENVLRIGMGAMAGYAASQTIAPDLRSWRLLPSNYQIKRLHLRPGNYTIELPGGKLPDGSSRATVTIEAGKPVFLNYRAFNPE